MSLLVLLAAIVSCGKTTENSEVEQPSDNPTRVQRNYQDVFMNKQSLICEEGRECPEGIVKVVVTHQGKVNFCTGSLIAENKVLTSASCLARGQRTAGLECDSSIFIVLLNQGAKEELVARCKNIIHSDSHLFDNQPAIWNSDVAVFTLNKNIKRKQLRMSRAGVSQRGKYSLWYVSYQTDKLGILKNKDCVALRSSYLNPLSDNKLSSMQVISGCDVGKGSVGAPLINSYGGIASLHSKNMNNKIYDYLRARQLINFENKDFYHHSNIACSKYSLFGTHKIAKECKAPKDFKSLYQLRAKMLNDKALHQLNMEKVASKIKKLRNKYFHWSVNFLRKRSNLELEAFLGAPNCLTDSDEWVDEFRSGRGGKYISTNADIEFSLPTFSIKLMLDRYLKAISLLEESDEKNQYVLNFNPYSSHVDNITSASLSSMVNGRSVQREFFEITNDCSLF